jgi:hypothetical protein
MDPISRMSDRSEGTQQVSPSRRKKQVGCHSRVPRIGLSGLTRVVPTGKEGYPDPRAGASARVNPGGSTRGTRSDILWRRGAWVLLRLFVYLSFCTGPIYLTYILDEQDISLSTPLCAKIPASSGCLRTLIPEFPYVVSPTTWCPSALEKLR